MASNDSSIIKLGPVGNINCGSVWDHKGLNKISQIFISHSDKIHSIQFQYADDYGSLMVSQRIGSKHRNKFDVEKINYPAEYITRISGCMKFSEISWIKFGTKLGEYGPFGRLCNSEVEEEFRFSLGDDNQFFGFHGTADETGGLRSIGVYFKPIISTRDDRCFLSPCLH